MDDWLSDKIVKLSVRHADENKGGNMNAIPVVGWFLSFVFATSTAIPFWLCWTVAGLGRRYFYFLPEVFQSIPFWHCVGLFTIAWILKGLVPTFASVSQEVKKS